jgi:hypothetical protein
MRKGNCAWCTGSFEGLSCTYRRKNTQLEFCTIDCLEDYEKYQQGHTKSRWLLAAAGVLALFVWTFATAPKARAHDHEGVSYGDWRQSNGNSCCNDADCQPATATMNENGSWIAFFKGRAVIIPKDKVLSIPSPDGRSHICIPEDGLVPYCFVPGEIRS